MKMQLLSIKRKTFLVLIFVVLAFQHGHFNEPQTGTWPCAAASAVVKSAEAADMPLCRVNLASLSKTSGAPGDVFEMYGEWEDMQGAKSAAINMGGGNKLEILSWTSKTLSVRIPKGLSPGEYKVGVYCNNPPHWQGSGFKDFTVTASALEDVQKDKVSSPATEIGTPPIAVSGSMALQPDAGATILPEANASAPQQKAVHNETFAGPQPQNQATSSIGGIVDAAIGTLSGMLAGLELRMVMLIVAGVVALLFLLKLVKFNAGVDVQINEKPYVKKPPARFDMFAAETKKFEPLTGVFNGVEYTAEELGDIDFGNGSEPTVTVHIDAKAGSIKRPMEINAREIRPAIAHDSRAADINSLLDCGATYIDIGHNTDWVAVELPLNRATIDQDLVEYMAGCLIRIRDLSR